MSGRKLMRGDMKCVCKGAKIYFKRDELNHTGSHKINNTQIGRAHV